jgi:hypothetical protein
LLSISGHRGLILNMRRARWKIQMYWASSIQTII